MLVKISNLRKLIRESLIENKNLLGPEDFKSNSTVKHALERSGAKVIPSGGSYKGRLGSGAYGEVFEVLWNGKRCAMKVTEDEDDWSSYVEAKRLRESVPNFMARHLPKIYKVDKVKVVDFYGDNTTSFYIIMEILEPPPRGILAQGWPDYHNDSMVVDKMLNDLHGVIFDRLKKVLFEEEGWYEPEILEEIQNRLGKDLNKFKSHFDKISKYDMRAVDIIKNIIINIIKGVIPELSYEFIREFKRSLSDILIQPKEVFPISGQSSDYLDSMDFVDPRINKLYVALKWLANNTGLAWDDLHNENVLYRPSDDSLVAVDVGLFSFGF
jgi:serine/threonine protein kinase